VLEGEESLFDAVLVGHERLVLEEDGEVLKGGAASEENVALIGAG
jgi:hypothetical protein